MEQKCNCGPDCTCGCQEDEECTCDGCEEKSGCSNDKQD